MLLDVRYIRPGQQTIADILYYNTLTEDYRLMVPSSVHVMLAYGKFIFKTPQKTSPHIYTKKATSKFGGINSEA